MIKKFYHGLGVFTELHDYDNDNTLALDVITIEPEITGEKQHHLHAQYFGAACPFS